MYRFLPLLLVAAVGCGTGQDYDHGPKKKPDATALEAGKKYLMASEPGTTLSVIDLRKQAKDGDEVVVAGKIGGAHDPFISGRAGFLLVDSSLKPAEECDCPWDYCDTEKDKLQAARLSVKFVDAEGKTLTPGARELFGLKELSEVVVKGKVSRDDKDNVVVLAEKLFVRPGAK
jgi:hypothetical protein